MKKIWILAVVKRGFIQEPEIFYDQLSAMKRQEALTPEINPDYDEIALFEKNVSG